MFINTPENRGRAATGLGLIGTLQTASATERLIWQPEDQRLSVMTTFDPAQRFTQKLEDRFGTVLLNNDWQPDHVRWTENVHLRFTNGHGWGLGYSHPNDAEITTVLVELATGRQFELPELVKHVLYGQHLQSTVLGLGSTADGQPLVWFYAVNQTGTYSPNGSDRVTQIVGLNGEHWRMPGTLQSVNDGIAISVDFPGGQFSVQDLSSNQREVVPFQNTLIKAEANADWIAWATFNAGGVTISTQDRHTGVTNPGLFFSDFYLCKDVQLIDDTLIISVEPRTEVTVGQNTYQGSLLYRYNLKTQTLSSPTNIPDLNVRLTLTPDGKTVVVSPMAAYPQLTDTYAVDLESGEKMSTGHAYNGAFDTVLLPEQSLTDQTLPLLIGLGLYALAWTIRPRRSPKSPSK